MPIVTAADIAAAAAAKAAASATAAAAAAAAADTSVSMPADGQIYISEIMFAGGGTLPQWIEDLQRFTVRRGRPGRLDTDGRERNC